MKFLLRILKPVLLLLLLATSLKGYGNTVNDALLKMINTAGDETSCTLSGDQKTIIFARKPTGSDNSDLFLSEFKNSGWSEPEPLKELNSTSDEITPALSADGNTVYFASNRQGSLKFPSSSSPSFDIYYSEKADGKWSRPAQLYGVINTRNDELAPFITGDGKTIYFTRKAVNAGAESAVIKVEKIDDYWEDIQTVKVSSDPSLMPYMAARSHYRSVYIFSALKPGGTWDIFFAPISEGNGAAIKEHHSVNTDGDDISFFELSSNVILVSSNSGGISGSYDLYIRKVSEESITTTPDSGLTIKTELKDYNNPEGIKISLLYFKSMKPGTKPFKSEIKTPDSQGFIRISRYPGIKRIIAVPGNSDMKEFAVEIIPGKKRPVPVIVIEKKSREEFRLKPVYFAFNSSSLELTDIPYIHELLEYLRLHEKKIITINGYADGTGSLPANKRVSLSRAESVKSYLIKHGISKNRIKTAGLGYINDSLRDTSQHHRRVEFIINE